MRRIAEFLLPFLALLPQPLAAQVLTYDFDFEEAEPAPAQMAPMETGPVETGPAEAAPGEEGGSERVVDTAHPQTVRGGEAYGPFRMLDASRAALVGVTDSASVADFEALLREHPGLATIEMIDCPGTEDDRANLRLGRMIRERGIAMHVPADGWVASGAVDLFLAGAERSTEPSARFAVHSWEDDAGRGPNDYAPDAPKNRAYIDYYRTMGMNEREARAFYAMTNSAPFSRPRSLTAADMASWAGLGHAAEPAMAARRGEVAQALPALIGGRAPPMDY